MNTYRVFGFDVESNISLPELLPARPAARPCLSIRLGLVEKFRPNVAGTAHHAGDQHIMFSYAGVARFRVSDGREIVVDLEAHADENLLRVCLLGPVLAAVLLQRGLLVLHASAVAIRGTASVFLGGKGWGKSTLAACLGFRGNDVLADDIVAVDGSGSAPRMFPGFPQLKLWPVAASALGLDPGTMPRLQQSLEKRACRLDGQFQTAPVAVGRIYVLEVGDRIAIERLHRRDAFAELLRHTYLLKYLEGSRRTATHFVQCAELVKSAPVYRAIRPPALALLGDMAALLEAHAESGGAHAQPIGAS